MGPQNKCAARWPADPLFKHLLEQKEKVKHTIIRDPKAGVEANYDRFLGDVLISQMVLREQLSGDIIDSSGCIVENTVVGIISTGYEYVVALFAIIALGGVAFPLTHEFSMSEKYSFMKMVDMRAMVFGQKCSEDIDPKWKHIFDTPVEISTRTIYEYTREKGIPKDMALIDHTIEFSPKRPAVAVLTSSTSSPAKCALLPRELFYQLDKPFRSPTDVSLCTRLPERCAGLRDLTDMICAGGCAEFPDFDASASRVWDRLRRGGINVLPATPALLVSMKDYFKDSILTLSAEEQVCYTRAAEDLRIIWTGGQPLAVPAKRFWIKMRKGRPLMLTYGSTEMGGLIFWNDISQTSEIRKSSLGTPVPTTEIKLSKGDHGELLLRKPGMMLRYARDPDMTQKVFDQSGFLKTNDLVRLNDGRYSLEGRESDFVVIDGSMVSIPDITESIQDLPYVAEAHIIAIGSQSGHQIAAIVRLIKHSTTEMHLQNDDHDTDGNYISIEKMRSDLLKELRECELPTVLRILGEHEPSPSVGRHRKYPPREVYESYLVPSGDRCLQRAD